MVLEAVQQHVGKGGMEAALVQRAHMNDIAIDVVLKSNAYHAVRVPPRTIALFEIQQQPRSLNRANGKHKLPGTHARLVPVQAAAHDLADTRAAIQSEVNRVRVQHRGQVFGA